MTGAIELAVNGRLPLGRRWVSERTQAVASMFGVAAEEERATVLPSRQAITIVPGEMVLITGASGTGKSTLLREIWGQVAAVAQVMVLGEIEIQHRAALVDCLDVPLEEALRLLALAGLSEARLFLRSPAELSEGEQFRFRLARFMASDADVLIADEFGATLDRVTAKVVAHQLGKFIRESVKSPRPRAAIMATSHEDLAGDLRPTLVKALRA